MPLRPSFLLTLLAWCWLAFAALAAKPVAVVLDAGHGGVDGGCYWGGVKEKDLTLKITKRVAAALQARGVTTRLTRSSDVYISPADRAAIANRTPSALLVSIHFNASRNTRLRGYQTFYYGKLGKKAAGVIHQQMARTRLKNSGLIKKPYIVLKRSEGPAVLVEGGFLSNKTERGICCGSAYQARLVAALTDGIIAARKAVR